MRTVSRRYPCYARVAEGYTHFCAWVASYVSLIALRPTVHIHNVPDAVWGGVVPFLCSDPFGKLHFLLPLKSNNSSTTLAFARLSIATFDYFQTSNAFHRAYIQAVTCAALSLSLLTIDQAYHSLIICRKQRMDSSSSLVELSIAENTYDILNNNNEESLWSVLLWLQSLLVSNNTSDESGDDRPPVVDTACHSKKKGIIKV